MFHKGDKFELHLEGRAHQEEVGENFGAEGAHEERCRCLKWWRAEWGAQWQGRKLEASQSLERDRLLTEESGLYPVVCGIPYDRKRPHQVKGSGLIPTKPPSSQIVPEAHRALSCLGFAPAVPSHWTLFHPLSNWRAPCHLEEASSSTTPSETFHGLPS